MGTEPTSTVRRHWFNWPGALPGILLAALVVVTYWPALGGQFLWDDDSNIIDSGALRSLHGLWRIWFQPGATQQYYPLTHSSFWFDYHIWGLHPAGYHFENILLHAISSVLLWRLLRRLNVPGAWLGAALFGLHPVNVESVAWITERKNTLSGVFFMTSLLAATNFWRLDGEDNTRRGGDAPRWRFYWLALGSYVFALWSKTATVGLPAVIWILIWWKRGRPGLTHVLQLLPFVAAGIGMSMMTLWVERHHLGVTSDIWNGLSWTDRVLIAGRAPWFYLGKLAWPHPLVFMYERWHLNAANPVAWLPVVAALAGICVLWRKRDAWGRPILAAAGCFVVMLFPILGFVSTSFFMYSYVNDHFQYLAEIGPLALAAAGITLALRRLPAEQPLVQTGVWAALLLAAGIVSWRQTAVFHSNESLWLDTLAHTPDSWMAHENLGKYFSNAGRFADAAEEYQKALDLHPGDYRVYENLGMDAERQGRPDDAMRCFSQALEIVPNYALGHHNLGHLLMVQGRLAEAQQQLLLAAGLDPDFAPTRFWLGRVSEQQGRSDEAIEHYVDAVKLQPDFAAAHAALGRVLASKGNIDDAMNEYQKALKSDPQSVDALANLGNAFVAKQRYPEAINYYQQALQLDSPSAILHYDLGVALERNGQHEEAQAELAKARQLQAPTQPAPK